MLKLGKTIRIVILSAAMPFVFTGQTIFADDYEPVKSLVVNTINQQPTEGARMPRTN